MTNARKPRQTKEQLRLEAALREYATRVQGIPSVAEVAWVPSPEKDLFTYIDKRDLEVMDRLMDIEDELFDLFEDEMFDFHVRYLEGRSLEETRPSSAEVIYRRA